jgi:hypothetical protein
MDLVLSLMDFFSSRALSFERLISSSLIRSISNFCFGEIKLFLRGLFKF